MERVAGEIQQGKELKHTDTADKSQPVIPAGTTVRKARGAVSYLPHFF